MTLTVALTAWFHFCGTGMISVQATLRTTPGCNWMKSPPGWTEDSCTVPSRHGLILLGDLTTESSLLRVLMETVQQPGKMLTSATCFPIVMTLVFLLPTLPHLQTIPSSQSTDFGVSWVVVVFVLYCVFLLLLFLLFFLLNVFYLIFIILVLFAITAIGNPRGDENSFLLTFGILWYRVHQYWARRLRANGQPPRLSQEDEWLFNRARQFTIATYQHVVIDEWLPQFLPRRFSAINVSSYDYNDNPGYSAYRPRTGYNQAINPQIAHIFQSAAMRWGHTVVTPGIWRRELR